MASHAISRPPRNIAVDWIMTLGGVWIVGGIYCDLAWHVRHDVDSFLTWAHGMLYAGLLYTFIAIAIISLFNVKIYGVPWFRAMPVGYDFAIPGVLLFFFGGLTDAIGHQLWGFESGFDALLSPTHQLIGISIMLLLTGPIRSALRAASSGATLASQLPAVISIGIFFALIHWGLNPLVNGNPEKIYAPFEPAQLTPDVVSLHATVFYMQGAGLASVVLQTLLLAAMVVYLVRGLGVRSGGITIAMLVSNSFIGFALAVTWAQGFAVVLASIAAGIAGDVLLRYGTRIRVLSAAAPFTYQAVFLLFTALFLGGIWWDPFVIFGSLLYSAIFGYLFGIVATQQVNTRS